MPILRGFLSACASVLSASLPERLARLVLESPTERIILTSVIHFSSNMEGFPKNRHVLPLLHHLQLDFYSL